MKRPLLSYLWLALLCVALGAAPWLGGQSSGVGPATARALVAAAGLAWLADRWGEWRLPRPAIWLWAFIAWSAVTALQRTNIHASLLAMSDLVTYAVLVTLAADAAEDAARRAVILGAMFLGAAVAGGLGVAHAFASGPGWREFGPFVTPNIFAAYLVTLLPVAILMAVRSFPKDGASPAEGRTPANVAVVILGIIAMAVGYTALLMTGSKGAVAALFLAVEVVFVAARAWRHMRVPMAVMAVMVLVFATGIGGRTLLGRVETAGTTEAHSSQFRVFTWAGAARMAAANPVMGTGIGTFGAAFGRYAIAGWTQAAHNAYLQTAAETGVPGLVLFLAALGTAALGLWKRVRAGSLVALGALAGLLAAGMHNGVDYGWSLWGPAAVLWALIGLGLGVATSGEAPKWAAALMGLVMAGTLIGGILVANAASIAESALDRTSNLTPAERAENLRLARAFDPMDGLLAREQGLALAQEGDQTAAMTALRDATRLNPSDQVAWRMLGEGYVNAGHEDEARAAFARGISLSPAAYKLLLDAARLEESTSHSLAAELYYHRLISAAEGPVGRYPATPEIVEIEPLYAYAALAAAADKRGDRAAATKYRQSLIALADRYEANRTKYAMIWRATGKDDPRELMDVQELRKQAEASLPSRSMHR